MIPANRQRNLLQSALYVSIAGILAGVLLERLLTYAEVAEKAAMELTVNRLQTGLYTRLAYLSLRGEHAAIEDLARSSPFVTTSAASPNYLGEFAFAPEDAAGGTWYFDGTRRELVYLPNLTRHLVYGDAPRPELRFRVELGHVSGLRSVRLRPLRPFRWEP